MLLGWILRTFGPDFRYRLDDDDDLPGGDFLMARISWRRFSEGLGALIATAGMVFVIATFLLILINPTVTTGTWVMLGLFALTLVAAAVWSWLYVGRYGTFGIVPDRRPDDQALRSGPEPAVVEDAADDEPLIGPAVPETVAVAPAPDAGYAGTAQRGEYDPDESFDEDDEAERRIRMSRYQSHVPDTREAEEYAPDEDTDVDADADDEFAYGDEPEFEEAGEPVIMGDEPQDEVDAETVTSEMDAGDADAEIAEPAEPEEEEAIGGDEGAESGDDDVVTGEGHLEDTPEGRAEALRRIQSWNPDDPDNV